VAEAARYAQVVIDLPRLTLFTYRVPAHLAPTITVGAFVLVPFEAKLRSAIVYSLDSIDPLGDFKLRDVEVVLAEYPSVPVDWLYLGRWLAEFYMAGYGESFRLLYPNSAAWRSEKIVSLNEVAMTEAFAGKRQQQIISLLRQRGSFSLAQLQRHSGVKNLHAAIARLQAAGVVSVETRVIAARSKKKTRKVYSLANDDSTQLSDKQQAVIALLREGAFTAREITDATACSASVIRGLVKRGLLREDEREEMRGYESNYPAPEGQITLNNDQTRAVAALRAAVDKGGFQTFLLHGITGSGKTQVYIEVIQHILHRGQTAICLLPEIALTPQTVARFRGLTEVAVWHSGLSDGQRFDIWRRLAKGEYRLLVGARSALFAPLPDLGLLIIDEEHEHAFKQGEGRPLYHARSAAAMLARKKNIPLILGSATPALESFHNAQQGKYQLLELPARATAEMHLPAISIIDMRKQKGRSDAAGISNLLADKIENRLYAGEKILLLQNRRGFAAISQCQECGFVIECPHCSVSMTLHTFDSLLHCHYCDFRQPLPTACPACDENEFEQRAAGTQQLETELKKRFTTATILRMDSDTTRGRLSHERILQRFAFGNTQILIGTQMIAKGLDIPGVTLVGVVNADIGLFMPDFRATERTFQLLTQIAGRSGRGAIPGEVIIQTMAPEHPVFAFVRSGNYNAFYKQTIAEREQLAYPPFVHLVLLRIEARDSDKCLAAVQKLGRYLAENCHREVGLLGPAPSPFSRLQGRYRWQILAKIPPRHLAVTQQLLQRVFQNREAFVRDGMRLVIDVDPYWIL
jgi:primosomal protein N' (replication factor Y)